MPSGKRKLTSEQAHARIRGESALSALGPREARLSICDRRTGEVTVINFADPSLRPDLFERPAASGIDWDSVAYALDRDLAELVNKYHPEFKDGGY